jgi:recombination protein RecR
MASQEIEALTGALARLPGLGPRSARRAVLHLVKKREGALVPLLAALQAVEERLATCSICGNVDTTDPCAICVDPRRDARALCVVEEVADLWALDRSRLFPGRFHVLGGRLSALEGVRPEDLAIDQLVRRVEAGGVD